MLSSLRNYLVNEVLLGPQTRQVRNYLNRATCDSVRHDLLTALVHQLGSSENELLRAIFDSRCIALQSQVKYWNEESFKGYIRSRHTETQISDVAVQLLWRSFYFYAHHPFPTPAKDGKIGFGAFQRAALLLIFQCSDLLGTRELDWYWRNDRVFFAKAGFERLFRSIGGPQTSGDSEEQESSSSVSAPPVQGGIASQISDAMDVLIMIGPQFMNAIPSAEQLEPIARRLLCAEEYIVTHQAVSRHDVSLLMGLLLRMDLKKEKWQRYYHIGRIVDEGTGEKELQKALTKSLMGNEGDETVSTDQLGRAFELMPDLQLRFFQLWAILFQPPQASSTSNWFQPRNSTELNFQNAISLFAPPNQSQSRYHSRSSSRDERLVLESKDTIPDAHDITASRLLWNLSSHPPPHVVVFVGAQETDMTGSAPGTVIGAYLSDRLKPKSKDEPDIARLPQAPYFFFQLQPEFRVMRCSRPLAAAPGLTVQDINSSKVLAKFAERASAAGKEKEYMAMSIPYWIGDPALSTSGLNVDPEAGTVTLTSIPKERAVGQENKDIKVAAGWEVKIRNVQMYTFTVPVSVDQERPIH